MTRKLKSFNKYSFQYWPAISPRRIKRMEALKKDTLSGYLYGEIDKNILHSIVTAVQFNMKWEPCSSQPKSNNDKNLWKGKGTQ